MDEKTPLTLLAKRIVDIEATLQCLMFALGKQPSLHAERMKLDFLECAELIWTTAPPDFAIVAMRQLTRGAAQPPS